jgi:hypothetical protein
MAELLIIVQADKDGVFQHLLCSKNNGKQLRCWCDPKIALVTKRRIDVPINTKLSCTVCDVKRKGLCDFWQIVEERSTVQ